MRVGMNSIGNQRSRQLWYDYFKSNKIDWSQYRERFIEEMMDNPKSIELIHWLSKFENHNNNNSITLICFYENEKNCHRSIVKELALNYYLRQQQSKSTIKIMMYDDSSAVGNVEPNCNFQRMVSIFVNKCLPN